MRRRGPYVEVNPFQNLPGLYSESKQRFYREQSVASGSLRVKLRDSNEG